MRAQLISLVAIVALLAVPAAASGSAGELYSFGLNRSAQLGNSTNNGTTNPNPTPTLVGLPGSSGEVVQVAAGGAHSVALTSTGQLYAFGENRSGQLGNATNNGTTNPNPTPTRVTLPGSSGQVVRIAAGGGHSLALTSTGQLYAFGDNQFGQLGEVTNNGTTDPNPTPTLVGLPGASGPVVQIAAGSRHSLALTSSGQAYAFGGNTDGELGNPTNSGTGSANPSATPVSLPGPSGAVVQIAVGLWHSLVLTSTGQLYAFGDNQRGQLGNATNSGTPAPNPTPTAVGVPGAGGQVVQIAAGGEHSLALTSTGQLYAFGYNFMGQLGNASNTATTNPNPTPTPVVLPGAGGQIVQIAGGQLHTLALTSSGQLYAFGNNFFGQLGNPVNSGLLNANPVPAPIQIDGGPTLDTIGVGPAAAHSLVVIADLVVATTSLPTGTTGASYTAGLQATGGLPPYRWSASGLPPGISIGASDGVLSGQPTASGDHSATFSVTDSHGIVASRVLPLAVVDPNTEPSAVRLQRAQLHASFRRSRVRGGASLSFSGRVAGPAGLRLTVVLAGPMRPRGSVRAVSIGTVDAAAGTTFSPRITLRRSLIRRLLPGRYELTLTAPGVAPGSVHLRLASPPEGVVLRKRISTSRRGPNIVAVTRAKRLWATFIFARAALPKRRLTVVWYAPHRRTAVDSFPVRAPKAFSFWENRHGLRDGRWRAVLKAGRTVVKSVSARVG